MHFNVVYTVIIKQIVSAQGKKLIFTFYHRWFLSLEGAHVQMQYLYFKVDSLNSDMVLILDGNSEHVANAYRKKYKICDCSRSIQMPQTEEIKEIASDART